MIRVTSLKRHISRHKILWVIAIAIILLYFIIRLFFTPPLLRHETFSNAYFDRHGEMLRMTLTPDEKYRLFSPLNEINPDLRRATILYEDKYFYWHIGINPIALVRAGINHFTPNTRPIGASTITMQVARMIYDMDTRTIGGKLKQIAAAIYIDAFYTKDEILTAYLNLAPYGGNIEGITAASLIYFNKTPDKLSKIEAITLSTIPQNPIKRGLNTEQGLAHMRIMRRDLTARWIEQNPGDASLLTLADMPIDARRPRDLPFSAPHFTDFQIRRDNVNKWGARQSVVRTTLDMELQRALQRALQTEINRRRDIGVTNAAVILVNYKTHETLAYIGSADYFDKTIFGENDGVQARRSPGSTLKPLIYATATDMGFIHPMTLLKDAKINFGVYAPENSDSEFYGPILARDALTHSRNVPAINLVRKIGTKNFYKILSDSGVTNLRAPEHYGISIALGGAEVSMYELADIYTTMANLGTRKELKTRMNDTTTTTQILSPAAFFLTLDMLAHQSTPSTNIPFAKHTASPIRHYWKTGTSSSFRDAWTAGIFGDYVLIVWVGNFDGRPNNAFSGARTAAPLYFALSRAVTDFYADNGTPIHNNNFWRDDLNVSRLDMCDTVGGIAGTHCPKIVQSYFIPGVSPIDTSPVYRAIPIDNKTGLRACTPDPNTTHMAVFEFWDAEYLDMFHRAGISRNTPPDFMPGCNLDDISATRPELIITSPTDSARLVIVRRDTDIENVSFQAISDNRTAKIFWFLNDNHIGISLSGETFTHPVPMGTHTLRTMDELGASSTINFSVIK